MMIWDSILFPTEEKYTYLDCFIKWYMNIFKNYLYNIDKTITLSPLDTKMILNVFYLELNNCLYEQCFACNYQIMALTPEHNQLYPHTKNTLGKSFSGNQTNHMIMGETKKMLFVVS